jgi:hypothetical protein
MPQQTNSGLIAHVLDEATYCNSFLGKIVHLYHALGHFYCHQLGSRHSYGRRDTCTYGPLLMQDVVQHRLGSFGRRQTRQKARDC